jgi:protocatechuate 3,4-dioxygenase beta subunit
LTLVKRGRSLPWVDEWGKPTSMDAFTAMTPEQIEGPYWLPGSPPRQRLLEPDTAGDEIHVTGTVRDFAGEPVADAWMDVWQCDGAGVYDIDGYRLRGHQHTDADGRYRLETVIPGDYEDTFNIAGHQIDIHRTPHIHIKIKARRRQTLTTQLYLPDHPLNASDMIFVPACIVDLDDSTLRHATFDFVLL